MAIKKWLSCEEELIRTVFISPTAREILQDSSKGALKRVASLITTRYKEAFNRPFAAESTAEFAVRQAAEKRPHRRHLLVKRVAELEAECDSRLEGVSTVSSYEKGEGPRLTDDYSSAFTTGAKRTARIASPPLL